ncbi:MAG: phosphopantothenoylcysteine decarboxylase, partial [Candidatus Korobacteraceae bacterium]
TSVRPPSAAEVVSVETTAHMREAELARMDEATVLIKAAAVADYTPRAVSEQKLKRGGPVSLNLEPTADILSEVARRKKGQIVIGFAAETENVLENARKKLAAKSLDAIVANDISQPGIGMDSDRNAVAILTATAIVEVPEASKFEVAQRILDSVRALRDQRGASVEAGLRP